MLNGNWHYAAQQRGDWVNRVNATGRRVPLRAALRRREQGFTLLELVITITVLTILTLGVMPLVKVSVQRQKEQRLRETLRQIRTAIDEFHRDTVGINCSGQLGGQGLQGGGQGGQQQQGGGGFLDPRSKVVISDCTIFGIDNPDHYPPDLETLVDGVNVIPRGIGVGQLGGQGLQGTRPLSEQSQLSTKLKVYMRAIPVDPMTGKAEWDLRSTYDPADSTSWGGENVFDIRSKSKEKALN
ncbi:MAG TPA: type II secretion system protein, partial [Pyrinomonadaceae bacterium]|nr:type II secretion system protein [Pyrinomonadaceae bacterium]